MTNSIYTNYAERLQAAQRAVFATGLDPILPPRSSIMGVQWETTPVGVGDIAAAAAESTGLISVLMARNDQVGAPDPQFDPGPLIQKKYEPYAPYLRSAVNLTEFRTREAILERRIQNREILSNSMALGLAFQGVAAMTDPTTYIGAGWALRASSMTQGFGRGAIQQGIAGTAQAAMANIYDPTGGMEDVLLSGALSGMAGGVFMAGHAFDAKPAGAIGIQLHDGQGRSVSAAYNPMHRSYVGDDGGMPIQTGIGLERVPTSPMARLLSRPYDALTDFAESLFPSPWYSRKNAEGIAPAESIWTASTLKYKPMLHEALSGMSEDYWRYRGQGGDPGFFASAKLALSDAYNGRKGYLSPSEFRDRVTDQAFGRNFNDAIPEVNQAAKRIAKMYDEIGDELVNVGFFKADDIKNPRRWATTIGEIVESYGGPTVWNLDALAKNKDAFMRRWNEWKAIQRQGAETMDAESAWRAVSRNRAYTPIDDDMTGTASGLKARGLRVPYQFFKEFLIRDSEVLARYYTRTVGTDLEIGRRFRDLNGSPEISMRTAINDALRQMLTKLDEGLIAKGAKEQVVGDKSLGPASALFQRYSEGIDRTRDATARLHGEVMSRFDGTYAGTTKPTPEVNELLRKMQSLAKDGEDAERWLNNTLRERFDAHVESSKADFANTIVSMGGKESRGLLDDMWKAERDMRDLRDALRGTLGQTDDPLSMTSRGIRVAKQFTAMTVLSGALASLPDVASMVFNFGLRKAFGDGFEQLRGGLKAFDMSKGDMRRWAVAMEMSTNDRALAMADLSDIHGRYTRFERAMDAGNSLAFVLNLISPWTDIMQRTTALFVQDRVLEAAHRVAMGKPLGKRLTADLARSGIDEDTLRAIAKEAFGAPNAEDALKTEKFVHRKVGDWENQSQAKTEWENWKDNIERGNGSPSSQRSVATSNSTQSESVSLMRRQPDWGLEPNKWWRSQEHFENYYKNWREDLQVEARESGDPTYGPESFTKEAMLRDLYRSFNVEGRPPVPTLEDIALLPKTDKDASSAFGKAKRGPEKPIIDVSEEKIASQPSQDTSFEAFLREKGISEKDVASLPKNASEQIDAENDFLRKQANAAKTRGHAEKVDGLWVGNSANWTDQSAVRALDRAVTEDVRRVIVEPHKGELPVWLSTELGSLVGMFKGFAVASANRMAIPALQMRDQQALTGALALVAAGFVVDQIRHSQGSMAHQDRPLSVQLGRAIERSGVLGYLTDLGRGLDALTAGNVGYGALIGERMSPKPTDLLGPVASQIGRASNVLSDVVTGDWNSHSARDLRRLAPLGATAHLDWGFDQVQAFAGGPRAANTQTQPGAWR